MNTHKTIAASVVTSLALGMLGGFAAPAYAAEEAKPALTATSSQSMLTNEAQAEELLRAIDQIPDSVLMQGDAATQAWVAENLIGKSSGDGKAQVSSFLGCSGAILVAIGTTAIPVAKILKIKRYMKALGGTREAIKILWGASFSHEKLEALGGAAAALGAELLGIAAVKEACT